jgi:hypothetical protein
MVLGSVGFLNQNEEETIGVLTLELIEIGVTPRRRAVITSLLQASVMVKYSYRCLSSTDNWLNYFPSLPSISSWLQLR